MVMCGSILLFVLHRKLKQLAELEEKWQATQGTSKSIYSIWHSYSSSIVTNIVENLQVCDAYILNFH